MRVSVLMDAEQANFLAALPYRKSIFRVGGWQVTSIDNLERFIRDFYLPSEIILAQKKAKSLSKKSEFRLSTLDFNIHYLSIWDKDYPYHLKNIYDPPPVLFFAIPKYLSQQIALQNLFTISVVGTRRASSLCRLVIEYTLEQLKKSKQGMKICAISGLAFGVDLMAHQIALEKKIPTWAVLGSGLYHCGPRGNHFIFNLAQKSKGSIILLSEFLHNEIGRSYHFPRRNRLIAGLSREVYVIQAAKKSGALITAEYAIEEGRDLWVFDHEIFAKIKINNEGCQRLIEQGAYRIPPPPSLNKVYQQSPDEDRAPPRENQIKAQQRELFENRLQGIIPLGNGFYLRDSN